MVPLWTKPVHKSTEYAWHSGLFRASLREGDNGLDLHLQKRLVTQERDGVIQPEIRGRLVTI